MIPLVYHPIYSELPLPSEHRYPITKYRLLFDSIQKQYTQNPQIQQNISFHQPTPLTPEHIKEIHHPEYVDHIVKNTLPAAKMRRIGFPWSEVLLERTLTSAAGTTLTAQLALEHGIALHLSGGYHHAHYDFGSGFCVFNDLAIAAHHALKHPDVDTVLIIDCDVHHGDGTATLFSDHPNIITLSVHCDKNFPARKPQSNYDLPLERGTNTTQYLDAITPVIEMATRLHQPDLVIYDAGVDIHTDDELGYFNVCKEGILERDRFILTHCQQQNIPVAAVVGGGYHTQHEQLIPLHQQLFNAAFDIFIK